MVTIGVIGKTGGIGGLYGIFGGKLHGCDLKLIHFIENGAYRVLF